MSHLENQTITRNNNTMMKYKSFATSVYRLFRHQEHDTFNRNKRKKKF